VKILAIIPARAGSKRLPNKNKLPLGGKPLITWSIDSARGVESICDIMVSTDDPEISEISKMHGALVPWLRPSELATDESHVVDTLIHAVDWYEKNKCKVDGVLLLQPTSPFRKIKTIEQAIEIYNSADFSTSVVSVSKVKTNPAWCFKLANDDVLKPLFDNDGFTKRAQDLETVYGLNGLIYIINPKELRVTKKVVGEKTKGIVVLDTCEALDIDTQDDFDLAELYLKKQL
jgi:CMP-N-acetylneuraminic acid synthetase